MTPHAEAIIKKMEDPSYPELNVDFAYKLTNESERGAVLIGASKVETYLESLILKVLPSNSKKYTSRLLNYPGSLSSFSGKIELCYAFRVIDRRVYESLNKLREIRNKAAHSNEMFSIQELKKELDKIYDFEEYFPGLVHELAYKNLIAWKKNNLKESLQKESRFKEYDHEALWDEHIPNPDTHQKIQEHLTVWKLAYGLTFLCLKIEVIKDEFTITPC